uniref:DNA/RNA non-specific endonuclease n=1 Tax=Alloprevotella sp. TaxID=1872471 RepID=UPI00402818A1
MNTLNNKYIQIFVSKFLFSAVILLALLSLHSCSEDHVWDKPNTGGGSYQPTSSITDRMETPRVLTDGSTVLIDHSTMVNGKSVDTYELEYDKEKLHSRWVAFRFDGNTRSKSTGRSDEPFQDDPNLSSIYHIGHYGFGGKYNRGHLCASNDRLYNTTANEQTFYMTNMSPQLGSFNQGYWITLESLVQRLGRNATFSDTLYVVKGGTIRDTRDNQEVMDYVSRSNGKRVAVPKYYYMALLKVKNGTYSSIAFWMEHKEYGYTYKNQAPLSEIKKTAITVNQLEERTGIDFFPNLPDVAEEIVENSCLPGTWGM